MARPREFDIDEALLAICQVFWQRGYRHTSIQDLVDATGLKRASLYGAFGNKQALFRQAMARYSEDLEARAQGVGDPETLLRGWFRGMLERSAKTSPPRGCLMLNSMTELQHLDPEEREAVLKHKGRLEEVFAHCVAWTHQGRGQAITQGDAQSTARALMATLLGLSVLSRGGEDIEGLMAIAEGALRSALGPGDAETP